MLEAVRATARLRFFPRSPTHPFSGTEKIKPSCLEGIVLPGRCMHSAHWFSAFFLNLCASLAGFMHTPTSAPRSKSKSIVPLHELFNSFSAREFAHIPWLFVSESTKATCAANTQASKLQEQSFHFTQSFPLLFLPGHYRLGLIFLLLVCPNLRF